MKVAIKEVNDAGGINGRPLKLILADTKSDPAAGAAAAQRVLGKGADIVVTTPDYDFGRAAAQVAQQKGKLVLGGAGSAKYGKQGIGPLAFNVGRSTNAEGATIAEYSYEKLGKRSAYTLLDPSLDYDKTVCDNFKVRWGQLGGTIAGANTYKNTDTSLASQVADIKAKKPDVIVLCGYNPGAATAIRQIRSGGVDTTIFGPASMDGDYWLKAVPKLSDFYYLPYASIYGDDPNAKVNETVNAAEKILGKPLDTGNAFIGYRQIQVIAHALKETGGDSDGAKLASVLDKLKNFDTIIGPISFTPDLHFSNIQGVRVTKIESGKHKLEEIWQPKQVPPIKF
jgi:branched-chain amino acid transport system substrate-binding protein